MCFVSTSLNIFGIDGEEITLRKHEKDSLKNQGDRTNMYHSSGILSFISAKLVHIDSLLRIGLMTMDICLYKEFTVH